MFFCKLINAEINGGDCVVVCDVADDMLNETVIDDVYKENENFKEICKSCKYHNYEGE